MGISGSFEASEDYSISNSVGMNLFGSNSKNNSPDGDNRRMTLQEKRSP
jgi:hypothetical protein